MAFHAFGADALHTRSCVKFRRGNVIKEGICKTGLTWLRTQVLDKFPLDEGEETEIIKSSIRKLEEKLESIEDKMNAFLEAL